MFRVFWDAPQWLHWVYENGEWGRFPGTLESLLGQA